MKKIMKWMHRGGALLLIAAMLFTQSGIVSLAEETGSVITIASAEDLVLLADSGKTENFSTGKTFVMTEDIDLSEYENMFIPIMDGTFDGGGHTITGIRLQEEMSDYGFFRYVGPNGTVANLTVEATVTSGEDQENIGIIAGDNKGTIRGCTSRGTLNGQTNVGGIAGKNETTGTISRCGNEAEVDGKQATGGIIGYNEGTVSDCTNSGKVNTNQKVVKSTTNGEGSINISIPNAVTGMTADDRANDTGGIAGYSEGSITYCKNEATIGHERLGSATGGVVGRQKGSLAYSDNSGVVYGHKDVGGIVGVFVPYETGSYDRDYEQELKDELDNLSSLMDQLSDVGDGMGNHLSDNVDVLREQLKSLKNSVRIYFDDYSDMASDGKDSIDKNVGAIRNTINGMNYSVNLVNLNNSITNISKYIQDMVEILKKLQDNFAGTTSELDETLEYYNTLVTDLQAEQQELQNKLDELQQNPPTEDSGSADNDAADNSSATDTSADSASDTGKSGTDTSDTMKAETSENGQSDKNASSGADSSDDTGSKTDSKVDTSVETKDDNSSEDKKTTDDSEKTEASNRKMVAVAYTVVTSPATPVTQDDENGSGNDSVPAETVTPATPNLPSLSDEQKQALMQALQALAQKSAQIQTEMQ